MTFMCDVTTMDPTTLELLDLWGNPFYVDWENPFRDPDDLMLFANFVKQASRYEWKDVYWLIEEIIRRNIPTNEELYREILQIAVILYKLLL